MLGFRGCWYLVRRSGRARVPSRIGFWASPPSLRFSCPVRALPSFSKPAEVPSTAPLPGSSCQLSFHPHHKTTQPNSRPQTDLFFTSLRFYNTPLTASKQQYYDFSEGSSLQLQLQLQHAASRPIPPVSATPRPPAAKFRPPPPVEKVGRTSNATRVPTHANSKQPWRRSRRC